MKIVFLISALTAGGAERVSTILCNAWAARGDKVTLISTYSGRGTPFYALSSRIETVFLADEAGIMPKTLRGYMHRLLTLRRIILARNPDVIVSFLPNVNVAAILAMARTRIPLIVCERNDPSSRSPLDPWELASRIIFRFADMLTVQTEAVAVKAAVRYPGVSRVRIVPNPLAPAVPVHIDKAGQQRKILLSLGRLADQKGIDTVIRAFAGLAPRYPDWDLHIYGEGPLSGVLESLAATLQMQGRVEFKGVTAEPVKVMAGADLFVMASKHEGFPNALLEAMSMGMACLVTDCPSGPKEITRDGRDALLVPLNDHRAFADALSALMSDASLRHSLGQRARESIRERFSLESVLVRWDTLFAEVTAGLVAGPQSVNCSPAQAQLNGSKE